MTGRPIGIVTEYVTRFDVDRWVATWTATGATAYGSSKEDAVERLDAAVDRLLDRLGKTGRGVDYLKKHDISHRWLPETRVHAFDAAPIETTSTYRGSKELQYA